MRRNLMHYQKKTPREKVRGKILVKGLEPISIVKNAYNAVFDLGDEKGSFDSSNHLHPIDIYDDIPKSRRAYP